MSTKGYEYKSHGPTWVRRNETSWPRAPDGLQYRLRYGEPTRLDLLSCAEIIAAYEALIYLSREARDAVVRALRKADKSDSEKAAVTNSGTTFESHGHVVRYEPSTGGEK